jgi:hypothetical protein
MPWRVALLAPLVVALVSVVVFAPLVREEHEVLVATPQPPPLFETAIIELERGELACAGPVPLSRETDLARVVAARPAAAAPTPLRVTVRASGYEAGRLFAGYTNGQALDVPLPDPPRPVDGEICVQNAGGGDGLLYASGEERTVGRLSTEVRGRPSETNLLVSLLARDRASLWDRRGAIGRGAAGLGPSFAPEWVIGALAALVLTAVPTGVMLALRRTPPGDGDQP